LMEQIMSFVESRIVQAAITRLVTSLNPAGAFIQAIIAIYNTVMFFVERLRQIGQVAAAFIDSISAIAAGSIGAAANRVEQTMAGLLTLVISFLARLVGLGRVSDAVKSIVDRIRAPIDRALDRVVDWIVGTARRLGKLVVRGAQTVATGVAGLVLRFTQPKGFNAGGEAHQTWVTEQGEPQVASAAMGLAVRIAGWRRRLAGLPAAIQATVRGDLGVAEQTMTALRTAAAAALRARVAGNAPAVTAAQTTVDQQQALLIPVLSRLFVAFGDTTAPFSAEEARLFAQLEAYDRVVVPLKAARLVTGSPASVSSAFRSQWNRGGSGFPIARGFATHMERVLAAARNVGTGRFPYLSGVEVSLPHSRIDYTTKDRASATSVPFDVATEVKHWGALRDRTTSTGRTLTIAQQVQNRMATLDNQITGSLQGPYDLVVLELRGRANMPSELTSALARATARYDRLAQSKGKRFISRDI
jgi:hypothetical protein